MFFFFVYRLHTLPQDMHASLMLICVYAERVRMFVKRIRRIIVNIYYA